MLLDTCALLWLSQGGGRLTQKAIEIIEFSPKLYISAISGFEIGIKHQKGKLTLPLSVNEWGGSISGRRPFGRRLARYI